MKFGSITTGIIADGLIFNTDPANRACYPKTRTTATDTVGNLTGSLTNGVSFNNTNEGIFVLDGSDDYVGYSNPSYLNFSADDTFSFSIWFKKGSSGTTECAFSKTLGSGDFNGYIMYFSGNLLHFRLRESTSKFHTIRDNNSHPLNTWVHYIVTYDGSRTSSAGGMELYKNGVKLTDVTRSGNLASGTAQSTANFEIGARSNGSTLYFDGSIGNLQIYNRELSATEVLHNYNALKSRFE